MQDLDGTTVYSATDLVGFLECEHLTTLDRVALTGAIRARIGSTRSWTCSASAARSTSAATWPTSSAKVARSSRGGTRGRDGDRNDRAQLEADARSTRDLMHQGADVIYQATLFDGTWRGYADFLLRTDGASDLGGHHYEVADTKLARRVKGGALLQMCVYSDLVAAIQGVMPTQMHVVLGGSGYQADSHRLDDYLAYYRSVKGRFLEAIAAGDPVFPLPQTPEPVRHCDVCRWQPTCDGWRKAADHLSQVASLRTDQARRLRDGGIGTMTALATLEQPLPEVPDMADATLAGLHQQARLQYVSRDRPVPAFEFLPVEPNRGLCALPEPNPGDLFFDIEGDPFAEQDGLEYLFGVWDPIQCRGAVPRLLGS